MIADFQPVLSALGLQLKSEVGVSDLAINGAAISQPNGAAAGLYAQRLAEVEAELIMFPYQ
jgi:hypothetical protein